MTTLGFLGFIVHYWGICWILMAVFAGMRANLAESAILRERAARAAESQDAVGFYGVV
jgi:hypothetical protein